MKRIETNAFVVCAMYRFVLVNEPEALQQELLLILKDNNIRGTMLVAAEGINGTVAGSRAAIDNLQQWLLTDPRFAGIVFKESEALSVPFLRTRVKLKKEIVTMGVEDINPNDIVGTFVKPEDWNELISSPDVITIDTRNDYEVQIGSFRNAVNPQTSSFREFPSYAAKNLDNTKHKKVAMFCTGGIRCEKSTAYLKSLGFEDVYHLEGGILNYLESIPEKDSLWQGECFVFDERVTVDHDLKAGSYDQCHACRMPLSENDRASRDYERGVSCPHCKEQKSDDDRERFRERELQLRLAKERGEFHIGASAKQTQIDRRARKRDYRQSQRQLTED